MTIESRVGRTHTRELKDLASAWGDLLLCRQVLHHRSKLPNEARNVFVRRALWEQAVIAFGRCFKEGRTQVPRRYLEELGPVALRTHEDVLLWRDKHVAHRRQRELENVSVWAVYEDDSPAVTSIRVRVSTALGPEDDLAERLESLADDLMKRLWEDRFRDLESALILRIDGRQRLRQNAEIPPDESSSDRIVITIAPSTDLSA